MKVKIRKHIYDIFKIVLIISANQTRKTANNNHSHSASVKENKKPNTMAVTPNATCLRILRSSRKTVLIPCQANSNELIKCLFFLFAHLLRPYASKISFCKPNISFHLQVPYDRTHSNVKAMYCQKPISRSNVCPYSTACSAARSVEIIKSPRLRGSSANSSSSKIIGNSSSLHPLKQN